MKKGYIFLLLAVGVLIGIFSANKLAKIYRERPPLESVRYVPKPSLLKAVALEYRLLLADFFWMKVTLIYGEPNFRKKATPEDWDYIEKTIQVVTELDPYFFIPYYFAGIVLPMEADRVDDANKFLMRGMKYLKKEWRIPFLIGFNYYYYKHEELEAAKYLEIASKLPGSPEYLPQLASRLRYQAGDIRHAIAFLMTMYNNTDNLELKKSLAMRIKALQDIYYLTQAVEIFKKKFNRPPKNLEELVETHIIKAIPRDPYGGKYYYDPKDGRVKTTSNFRPMKKNGKK